MKQGRLGYNSSNDRYGLLASDLWIDTGFHCGEGLEVLVDDKWVRTRMEMNLAREWYLVGTPYCGCRMFLTVHWKAFPRIFPPSYNQVPIPVRFLSIISSIRAI